MLEEMGNPQPETPLKTDNSTAEGILNRTILQRSSKTMDMSFNLLRDQENQNFVHVYWSIVLQNLGDYYTKHHQAVHHHAVHYIQSPDQHIHSLYARFHFRAPHNGHTN